jgi:hypothetical protein
MRLSNFSRAQMVGAILLLALIWLVVILRLVFSHA